MQTLVLAILLLVSVSASAEVPSVQIDPRQLVLDAMDHWRGTTSRSQMIMTIHRPDWQRSMKIRTWSKGSDQSLVRVVEPKKDAGTSTLVDDNRMWIFTPKVNRIVKVPSSMMAQAWMGSDFSNKDISKSTDIIDEFDHTLSSTRLQNGHTVYEIESVPHDDAAVVWGKEVLFIRDDFVLLEHQFWSQDNTPVKVMKALDIQEMGGRQVARVLRMESLDSPGEWTQLTTEQIEFGVELPATVFTLSNLRNPRL